MTPYQKARLEEMQIDFFQLADQNILDITDATMELIQTKIREIIDREDSDAAYQLIGKFMFSKQGNPTWMKDEALNAINYLLNI